MPVTYLEMIYDKNDKSKRDLKIEFGIDNVPIENHRLSNMY